MSNPSVGRIVALSPADPTRNPALRSGAGGGQFVTWHLPNNPELSDRRTRILQRGREANRLSAMMDASLNPSRIISGASLPPSAIISAAALTGILPGYPTAPTTTPPSSSDHSGAMNYHYSGRPRSRVPATAVFASGSRSSIVNGAADRGFSRSRSRSAGRRRRKGRAIGRRSSANSARPMDSPAEMDLVIPDESETTKSLSASITAASDIAGTLLKREDYRIYEPESSAFQTHNPSKNRVFLSLSTPSAVANGRMMFVRLLLDAKRVGSVIGQRGKVITAIRDKSEAKILIANASTHVLQRICTVEGRYDRVTHGIQLICDRQCERSDESRQSSASVPDSMDVRTPPPLQRCEMSRDELTLDSKESSSPPSMLESEETKECSDPSMIDAELSLCQTLSNERDLHHMVLLVDEYNAGVLIGKNGRNVEDWRRITNANIYISGQCLERSTEKSINICGTRAQVHSALAFVVLKLAEFAHGLERPRIAYDPNIVESNGHGDLTLTHLQRYEAGLMSTGLNTIWPTGVGGVVGSKFPSAATMSDLPPFYGAHCGSASRHGLSAMASMMGPLGSFGSNTRSGVSRPPLSSSVPHHPFPAPPDRSPSPALFAGLSSVGAADPSVNDPGESPSRGVSDVDASQVPCNSPLSDIGGLNRHFYARGVRGLRFPIVSSSVECLDGSSSGVVMVRMQILDSVIGSLIGKQGRTIEAIRLRSRPARIFIGTDSKSARLSDSPARVSVREVTIKGGDSFVQNAVQLISHCLVHR